MSEQDARPLVRRADEVDYEDVDAADGMSKGMLVGAEHGAPNLAIRRFVLEPGATVPKHTNDVEHEQYVLAGEYVVGIDDEEYTVSTGDSLFIPAGRSTGTATGATGRGRSSVRSRRATTRYGS